MNDIIKKVYDLLYSPIVTPFNLLENAKLENYSYVNYYKGEHGLIAEMKCITEDSIEAIFYYHFDQEDKLERVYMETNSDKNMVFDRTAEIERTKDYYLTSKKKNVDLSAV